MNQKTALNIWSLLEEQAKEGGFKNARDISFLKTHTLKVGSIDLDYSHQQVTPEIVTLLLAWAEERRIQEKIQMLMGGGIVNQSQKLPALHTALRMMEPRSIWVDDHDVVPAILHVRKRMSDIADRIRTGQWLGYSGKAISSIVNIGMGGSDFGPKFCVHALKEYTSTDLDYHFISDVDPTAFTDVVKTLDPETTLFIISSKSFTTYETLYNAKKAIAWIGPHPLEQHFIAVTAEVEKAQDLGVTHVLPIWDWVGGRYSLCSAIGLIVCIAIGFDRFMELLAGAHSMDRHFCEAALPENMPVLLALLGCWNINFLKIPSLLLLVYARRLELLVPYIQQLDMESNGKSIDKEGNPLNYATGPIVWGGLGNQAQHSYYQLLAQGSHKIAADCISVTEFDEEPVNAFCSKTIRVLNEGVLSLDNPGGYIFGGMPINHIKINSCTPFNIGALIALYEHKIFAQSVLWRINPFDQPGVDSAKRAFNCIK